MPPGETFKRFRGSARAQPVKVMAGPSEGAMFAHPKSENGARSDEFEVRTVRRTRRYALSAFGRMRPERMECKKK